MSNQVGNLNELSPELVRKNRIKLVAIASVFILPLAAAMFLYFNVDRQALWATSNHGDFITPVKQLQPFELSLRDKRQLDLESFKGKWTLVYFSPENCGDVCKKNIYHMRQVRAGLGKNMHRVNRLLVLHDVSDSARSFLEAYPELWVTVGPSAGLFQQQFFQGKPLGDKIYLVDPLGNLMMSFSSDLDPRGMLKDIKKLLKISKVG